MVGLVGCAKTGARVPQAHGPASASGIEQVADISTRDVSPHEEYIYPLKVDDIAAIYNKLAAIQKNEFETTQDYEARLKKNVDIIVGDDKRLIIRAKLLTGDHHEQYNADEKIFKYIVDSQYFMGFYGGYDGVGYYVPIVKKTKESIKTGRNAFGASISYADETGKRYGIFPVNKSLSSFSVAGVYFSFKLPNTSIEQAKNLKKHQEMFFICEIIKTPNNSYIFETYDSKEATINSPLAWSIKGQIIPVKIRAILLCDKSKKEILSTIRIP